MTMMTMMTMVKHAERLQTHRDFKSAAKACHGRIGATSAGEKTGLIVRTVDPELDFLGNLQFTTFYVFSRLFDTYSVPAKYV